jgi:hypothetical protein
MTVTQLIASLASLPPDAIVRVFSTEYQDWMPINDIDHCVLLGVGDRIDLRAYHQPDEDDDCAHGIHSWIDAVGKLPPDTKCTRCGELYGNPD